MAEAIATMRVRGAPDIGIAAAYGVVLAARRGFEVAPARWKVAIEPDLAKLAQSRPTAVNLFWALDRMDAVWRDATPLTGVLDWVPEFSPVRDPGDLALRAWVKHDRDRLHFAFEITDEEWRHFFEVNVMSGIRFARHYAPGMARRGWGRVVFVSSESALNIPKEMIHYGMTKTAQLSIMRGMAMELAGSGVTVNALLPGPTHTENTDRLRAERARAQGISLAEIEAGFFRDFRPTSLLKRFTSADEVANLGVYLCSEAASGTSGAAMRVDGGVVNQIM